MTTRFKSLALLGLCVSLALAGCGRKGSLDNPGTAAQPAVAASDPAVAAAPVDQVEPIDSGPFFLDFLIE